MLVIFAKTAKRFWSTSKWKNIDFSTGQSLYSSIIETTNWS